jgi:hypothetical protein
MKREKKSRFNGLSLQLFAFLSNLRETNLLLFITFGENYKSA